MKFGIVMIFLIGLLTSLPVFSLVEPQPAVQSNTTTLQAIDIEVFVRTGCPHCAKAEAFLEQLHQEQPDLKIIIHNVADEPTALERLKLLAEQQQVGVPRVPALNVRGQLIIGYSDEVTTGQLIRSALRAKSIHPPTGSANESGSCDVQDDSLSCEAPKDYVPEPPPETFALDFWGHRINLDDIGLPIFTLAMGLLDGFNPCSLWVLILMISLLAPMQNRWRMLAIAGTFVLVEGIAYFIFMAAWLNLFLLIGLSRASQIAIALIAIGAGALNLKDFWWFGKGLSLSIPKSAKPGIYTRMRTILSAQNLSAAIIGAIILAILVQIVEFMCTSGFPALYTRILTLRQLDSLSYYGYLLLYNLAYMFDDIVILSIGVITLSQRRLQEKEGRWLKLLSGAVMVGLGLYLLINPT